MLAEEMGFEFELTDSWLNRPSLHHTPPAIAQWLHNRAVVRQWSLEVIGVSR